MFRKDFLKQVKYFITVETPNKGLPIFWEMGHVRDCSIQYFFRAGQIKMKIRYKTLFWGLVVSKVFYKGGFQAYLSALSGDHCDSDPFLGLFCLNFDANKGRFSI